MKKNTMMRLASFLLIAVLITTSAISGTYAKYVTSDSASDTARVAKWGIVLQADGRLYGENYGTGINSTPTTDNVTANLSVEAAGVAVAPGTQNAEGMDFSINGTPEVRTRLDATIKCQNIYLVDGTYALMVKAPTVTATSWAADTYYTVSGGEYTVSTAFDDDAEYYSVEDKVVLSADYYPVVYTSTDFNTGTISVDSLNEIAADYATKLNNGVALTATPDSNNVYTYTIDNKVYDPNFDYSTLGVAGETLTWKWEFEQASNEDMYDGADTILANLQAGTLADAAVVKLDGDIFKAPVEHTDYNLETEFSIDITVTQVD